MKRDNESVYVHMMGGGTFHVLIGDGDITNPGERTTLLYGLIEEDTPLYGSWLDPQRSDVDLNPAHTTVIHIAGRHAVRFISA